MEIEDTTQAENIEEHEGITRRARNFTLA